ncbi:MAG TPA: hypothetical protein DIT94_09020 [Deltaproteobacteria bacterium]|nr:hypothetical protein [Deltaproteobacteria bacterium]MBI13967.1 hypothetical protein [Deltaproteobacteria bacterium]HCP34514.1 hypothetical protein [Deltaproteobacteria bacterium]
MPENQKMKMRKKFTIILFLTSLVLYPAKGEEIKEYHPELPDWLQERPRSTRSEDNNAFHPRRPFKWWNAEEIRDTQKMLFGIIYDEKTQRRSMEVSKGRWEQGAQTAKNCSIHRCGN